LWSEALATGQAVRLVNQGVRELDAATGAAHASTFAAAQRKVVCAEFRREAPAVI
jgi:hypothetical protein